MSPRLWMAAALAVCAATGCSREETLRCDPAERYAGAGSVPPVRIPDDLSPPNESEALQLPPAAVATGTPSGCLETPPDFFDGGASQRGSGPAAERPPPQSPPAGRAAPLPAPSGAGDREISN